MKRIFTLLTLLVGLLTTGLAQPNPYCPGLHNPTNFNSSPGGSGSWSARVGDRVSGSGGSTGSNVLSTCASPNSTVIRGANILSSTYYSGNCSNRSACGHATLFDGHDQRFRIYTAADAGLDLFTVNAAGQGMPRIPAGHTSSIRLGDMRATGQCQNSVTSTAGNNKGAEALYYTMRVNANNALLFIDYAVVACRYNHSPREAGEFIIRVVGKNPTTGQWNSFPLNDSLWFNVPAPAIGSTLPAPWIEGLNGVPSSAGATSCCYCYKDWTRVAISLLNYLYDSVRVEMYTSDCIYDVDPIYAYIAGDCQPMTITSSGCPGGSSDAVDTLHAPEGLLTYQWYVASNGFSGNTNSTDMSTVPFRQLNSTTSVHVSRLSDFITNTGDTVGTTTYKCVMTSAMDPAKPFQSVLYSTVSNTKPIVRANFETHCDGTVDFEGLATISYQGANAPRIVDSLSLWEICQGSMDNTPVIDTVMGRLARYTFTDHETHAIKLTMYTDDDGCYTTKSFQVTPTIPANTQISIDKRTLCVGDQATITDLTTDIVARTWVFADQDINSEAPGRNLENTRVITRDFTEFENPFMLITTSTSGCLDTLYDTIYFFNNPDIYFSADTIICNGHETSTVISTPVHGCSFEWYRRLNRSGAAPVGEGYISSGNTLRVRPTQNHTWYYVKIIAESGCEVWDSVRISILNTKIDVSPKNGKFCPGDSVTLTGSGAVWYEWYSMPNDPDLVTKAHQQSITVAPAADTRYYLIGYAADSCDIAAINVLVQPVDLPVIDFEYSPHFIDTEVPVVNFYDKSEGRDHTKWLFSDGSQTSGQNVTHHFDIYMDSSNCITMESYNEIGCYVDTTFCIDIDTFGLYIPNIFTPTKGDNNKFQVVCPSGMDKFHIAIFNRKGLLVFESDDQFFSWDGTRNGTPLPTGTYPYVITYTRAGSVSDFRVKGTVTIVR